MSEPFLAEVRIWALNFAPRGWAFCNGQILPISQNSALFSLLGTTYGGNGTTSFGLPDLMGRSPMQQGSGPGLTPRVLGEASGSASVTLLNTELPSHTHGMAGVNQEGQRGAPESGDALGFDVLKTGVNIRYLNNNPSARVPMSPNTLTPTGGSQPHENQQPYLALNFCIAMEGIFPPRS
ncbi:MAG TPA: phage tail protein [Xanthomonadales bacterium]|nr:phage tail protein [Xanthomonadales bacterium]